MPYWRNVHQALEQSQQEQFQRAASEQTGNRVAFLGDVENCWYCLAAWCAGTGLVVLVLLERRRKIRRWWNGSGVWKKGLALFPAALLVGFPVVVAGVFVCSKPIAQWILGPEPVKQNRDKLEKLVADTAQKNLKAEQTSASFERLWHEIKGQLEPSFAGAGELLDRRREVQTHAEQLAVALDVRAKLAEQVQKEFRQSQEVHANLASQYQQASSALQRRRAWRTYAGLGWLGFVGLCGILWIGGIYWRRRKNSRTCIKCARSGKLEPVLDGERGSKEFPGVECKYPTKGGTKVKGKDKKEIEICDYWFAERLRHLNRICFPTLGHSKTGKTVWLAMAYDKLTRARKYADSLRFDRERDKGTVLFDRIVDTVLHSRQWPDPTQTRELLPPLLFDLANSDRLGSSHDLLVLLDLPGKVTNWDKAGESSQRDRALKADGFIFFIEPTGVTEDQDKTLNDFIAELSQAKFGQRGRQLRTPIAFCVSKLEMMIHAPYARGPGRRTVEEFYRELSAIGWDEKNPSLDSIRRRHRLMAEMQKTIWPDWDIPHSIGDRSGGHHMFFPLTSIGMEEPDEDNSLANRNIQPRGIIEPLLWLLHMNGCPVFRSGARRASPHKPLLQSDSPPAIIVPPPVVFPLYKDPAAPEPGAN